ncbi:MAG: UDP-N-acetylglucosamine 2-epimerase (hydrolyzing) [Opitutae bacterium]|nr:UDP-N-acetylglucosamine 2-epimerase (hydrolyzing) [Opitutae bacterium]
MRRIGVVTVGRSDFGLYRPLLARLRARREVRLKLFVAGAHLAREHGRTVTEIEAAGFRDYAPVPTLTRADDEVAVGIAAGRGTAGFARAFAAWRPDILVVLGDRYEMHAAVVAAVVLNIPVAHLHGGEISEGAIDDTLRHSMTKLSHLHFASAPDYARRIRQMGEEPWRVHHVGAIGLDNVREVEIMSPMELGASLGWKIPSQFILFTYHPVTLGAHDSAAECRDVLAALEQFGLPVLFTAPNADAGGRALDLLVRRYVARRRGSHYVNNLGLVRYYSAMTHATLMAGNSSSGIIEAASFDLPVVNIGERQRGRLRPRNVIDCAPRRRAVLTALRQALRTRAEGMMFENPYDAGGAAARIVRVLLRAPLGGRLLQKKFIDAN